MQHLDETSKTLKIYACSMCFQYNIILQLGGMEAHRCRLNAGMEIGGGVWSSPVRQRREQLANGVVSHEAPPSARGLAASVAQRRGIGHGVQGRGRGTARCTQDGDATRR
jgi:hypothetical protein